MRKRSSLPYLELPEIDRRLFERAVRKGALFEPDGLAAHWAPATLAQVKKGYCKFAFYLGTTGALVENMPPSQRIDMATLEGYVGWLQSQDLSSVTITSRATDLREAIRVMEPGEDLDLLSELVSTLRAREAPRRNKHTRLVHPQFALDTALNHLDNIDTIPVANEKIRACRYRDALIIAFLAARPIRLKNLSQLTLGISIVRDEAGYSCHFTAEETKERMALSFQLPDILTPYLDYYLGYVRPLLLDGRVSDRLWITLRRRPMAAQTIYCHVSDLTEELFGHRINPHLFRDMVATAIATDHPDHVLASARLLHNASIKTTSKHYIQSQMIDAQRILIDVIDQRRRSSP